MCRPICCYFLSIRRMRFAGDSGNATAFFGVTSASVGFLSSAASFLDVLLLLKIFRKEETTFSLDRDIVVYTPTSFKDV